MNSILEILKSSLITTVLTFILNFYLNRKKDTLSYITLERKQWREKIRELAEKIEHSTYGGEGDRYINPYLVQLKMNINTYGKGCFMDIEHDSHIWQSIEKIRDATSTDEFNKEHEILLDYLSLMLKNDWERCKKEVKGNSLAIYMTLLIVMDNTALALDYFFICSLDKYIPLLVYLSCCNMIPIVVFAAMFYIRTNEIGKKRIVGITRENKEKRISLVKLFALLFAVISMIVSINILNHNTQKSIMKNVYADEKLNTIYIELNDSLSAKVKDNMKVKLKHDVILVKDFDFNNMKQFDILDKEQKEVIVYAIRLVTKPYMVGMFVLAGIMLYAWEVLIGVYATQKDKYKNVVIKMRERQEFDLVQNFRQLSKLHKEVIKSTQKSYWCKLLDLEYELLVSLSYHWEQLLYKKDFEKKYMSDLTEILEVEEKLKLIKKCKNNMKRLKKSISRKKINKLKKEIGKQIADIGK